MSLTSSFVRFSRSSSLLKLSRAIVMCRKSVNSKKYHHEVCCNSQIRKFSMFSKSPEYSDTAQMDLVKFESVCATTIDSLTDYFEEITEADPNLINSDVAYSDGVLTIKLGSPHGTYVINRQTPNRQIWLSSPTSGPKRYDYVDGKWIYKHDGVSLHQLLQSELEKIFTIKVDFLQL